MQAYTSRIASFAPPPRSKSNKAASELRWPHPNTYLATPATLAAAGFYFNPSVTTPDAVSCFLCDKGLADWDPEDDPAEIHADKCPKCPWAILKCLTDADDHGRLTFASPIRFPTSRTMEKARLATFGPSAKKWWPHKAPSSKTMAKAGFAFTPSSLKDDTCLCIYCGIELGGWQPEDDPMEEHRSRQAKKGPCPFFVTPNESTSRARPRTKSKALAPATPAPFDDDEDNDEYQPPGTRSSKRASTSSKKPSTSAKSSTKSRAKPSKPKAKTIQDDVVEEYHVALVEDEDAPSKPRPKSRRPSSRSRSRSRSRAPPDKPETQRSTRSRSRPPPDEVSHDTFKSFQSPEDEEFAREEEALEEQARELMHADTMQTPATPGPSKGGSSKDPTGLSSDGQKGVARPGKAEALEGGDPMDSAQAGLPPPSTPPPRPAAAIAPTKTGPTATVKFPHIVPDPTLVSLTDVERAMTVEQWVRYELDRQYEQLNSDGRQKIDAFKARAAEVAKQIEGL